MSGHASQAVVDLRAENHSDSDHKQTSLHNGNPDAEIHSENDDGWSHLGQPKELRNGHEPRGCGIPPCAAGPTESNSNSDEVANGREPRRWMTETEWTRYIQKDPHCPPLRNRRRYDVSIFRVPKFLKDTQREAYVPRRVSLGPYHHGSAKLISMDHHKGRAVRRMMQRFNDCNKNLRVDPNDMNFANRAVVEILKLENEIRDNYEENIDCDGETLARMLCLDGCFLLEVLRTLAQDKLSRADECYDPIFGEKNLDYAASDIVNDILILENQIPLIVLQKLLHLELNRPVFVLEKLLSVLALRFLIPFNNENFNHENLYSCNHYHHHLLGFLHTVIASRRFNEDEPVDECKVSISLFSIMFQGKSKERNGTATIPHAVELKNAGIKFSALQGSIQQIKFDVNSTTIFLPPISIMYHTEGVFRNLIAYEMCKPSEINWVTCFVSLMNCLIDSEQDVALLRRMGVLTNWLASDKEVVDLFKGLCKAATVRMEEHVFDNLTEKVTAHYNNNEMKIQFGILKQDHFSSPWKALALTGTTVILLLTLLQTIFTIISTYKK